MNLHVRSHVRTGRALTLFRRKGREMAFGMLSLPFLPSSLSFPALCHISLGVKAFILLHFLPLPNPIIQMPGKISLKHPLYS